MAKQKKEYRVGIDLGGTKLLVAAFDEKYKILSEQKAKTEVAKGEKHFWSQLVSSLRKALKDAKVPSGRLSGIGVGSPGIIDKKKGVVISSPNIPFFKNYELASKLKKVFHAPVVLENDVNTGLYGEQQFGAARGYSDVVGIFLGTGVGGALILNGKLYRGTSGAAGEVGHMLMDPMGPVCGCGNRGCLEALTGRLAITSEAAVLAARRRAPELYKLAGTDISEMKSKVLARAIKSGDQSLKKLIQQKAKLLGIAMANIVNLLNPELFVLGGGMVEAMEDLIIKEAEKSMYDQAMPDMAKHVQVMAAKLGDYAIVKGAAKLSEENEK